MISEHLELPMGRLRPLHPDDAPAIVRACSDREIARWTQVPQPYSLAHAEDFIGSHGGEDHVWAMDVDGLAGVIGVRDTLATMPGPSTEVGYWVAPWARGAGLATAALVAVRDELARVGYQRIDWEALAGNEASVRVALKAGFMIEGHKRRGMSQRGRLVDAVVGGWTADLHVPELVAGAWQVQPLAPIDVPGGAAPHGEQRACGVGSPHRGRRAGLRPGHGHAVGPGSACALPGGTAPGDGGRPPLPAGPGLRSH
ncbi:MAG: GNAT family N-acetyltransferase [Micrococcales bacterium]|nr:GNAT family N-acetyltransferase [Micrococcales bacterium]